MQDFNKVEHISNWSKADYGHGKILADIFELPRQADSALPPTPAIITFTTILPSRVKWELDDARHTWLKVKAKWAEMYAPSQSPLVFGLTTNVVSFRLN